MDISAMLSSLEGGGGTTATATAASISIATATATAVGPPPRLNERDAVVARCCRRRRRCRRARCMLSSLGGGGATATAVGSPPRLNERDAVVTTVDPLSAIARSSASRRPWASARRRDDGDGDGRLDRDGDGCRPPPRLNERDAVVARCCRRRRRCRRVNVDVARGAPPPRLNERNACWRVWNWTWMPRMTSGRRRYHCRRCARRRGALGWKAGGGC
jgi:hypothetical protein